LAYVSNLPPPLKSVPAESLFSTAGLLLNSKRSAYGYGSGVYECGGSTIE